MKPKTLLLILCVICCISLTGCSSHHKTNSKTQEKNAPAADTENDAMASSSAAETNGDAPLPSSAAETEESKPVDAHICFIGNSLIEYGNQAGFLVDLSAAFDRNITVDQITWGGSHLYEYAAGKYIDKDQLKQRLQRADIVVFQDYGGWQGEETWKAIRKLIKWCAEDADFYYYMYDEDENEMQAHEYKKLTKLGLKCIPKGQIIDALDNMSYTFDELHLEGDFHPNIFNGYMAALVMNGTIFGEKCTDLPKEWFFAKKKERLAAAYEEVHAGIHGESEEEKWEEFQKICQKADQFIQKMDQYNK